MLRQLRRRRVPTVTNPVTGLEVCAVAAIDSLKCGDFDLAALQNQMMTAGLSRDVPFAVSSQTGSSRRSTIVGVSRAGLRKI